jgi:hypothetical protein
MFQRYYTPFSILLVFSLGFFGKLEAQNLMSITGKVITYEQSKPLEYVSLKLFQLPDSTFIKGSFSNPEGRFEIMAPPGKYFIQMSVARYENEQTEAFELKASQANLHLGTLRMQVPKTQQTKEVKA